MNGFTIVLYEPTGNDPFDIPAGILEGGSFTTAAKGGFKQAILQFSGLAEDLLNWYYDLGRRLVIYGPDGRIAWEGAVSGLEFSHGIRYDLSNVFNAVNVVYSSGIGLRDETGWLTNDESIMRFGRRELLVSTAGMTAEAAQSLQLRLLYFHAHSLAVDPFMIPSGAPPKRIIARVTAYGWYTALNWRRWQRTAEGPVDTGTQIQYILDTDNSSYWSTTSTQYIEYDSTTVPTTGIEISQYRPDQMLTQREEVERLSSLGCIISGSSYPLWFQVWENRYGWLKRWTDGNFPEITLYYDARTIYDRNGMEMPAWMVRADNVLSGPAHLPLGFGMYSDPLDLPQAYYILETSYDLATGQLRVWPAGWRDFVQMMSVMPL